MELLGLPTAEQGPGAALDLPITWYPPLADALLGHGSSALPCDRDRSSAPTVLPSSLLTHTPPSMFAGNSSALSLLSYYHWERLSLKHPPSR